jgi:NAD(P)-dependent dehydrogenase (short-subunit alcohol dehydrogenase family)
MTDDWKGRHAVVTGVGRAGQVGETVAAAFLRAGADVVLVDRQLADATARAGELRSLGGTAHPMACDLSDVAAVDSLVTHVAQVAPNGVHALVCLAGGFGMSGPVADSDPAVYQKMLAINLTTAYLTTRAFLPALRRVHGAIVYFSSAAVLPGATGARMSGYAAAKAGVAALMRAVADEEAANGVRANAPAPTAIRTAANENSMNSNTRYVEREQVADVTLFLCSDAAHAITGQLIRLDA